MAERVPGRTALLLHPVAAVVALLAAAAGAAVLPAGPVSVALLVAVAGAAAGFANSGST
jgi:hypothetical protein